MSRGGSHRSPPQHLDAGFLLHYDHNMDLHKKPRTIKFTERWIYFIIEQNQNSESISVIENTNIKNAASLKCIWLCRIIRHVCIIQTCALNFTTQNTAQQNTSYAFSALMQCMLFYKSFLRLSGFGLCSQAYRLNETMTDNNDIFLLFQCRFVVFSTNLRRKISKN